MEHDDFYFADILRDRIDHEEASKRQADQHCDRLSFLLSRDAVPAKLDVDSYVAEVRHHASAIVRAHHSAGLVAQIAVEGMSDGSGTLFAALGQQLQATVADSLAAWSSASNLAERVGVAVSTGKLKT